MRVEIILDSDPRDNAMHWEISGWLHFSPLRGSWTMTETLIEDDEDVDERRTLLRFAFNEPLDAHDFCHWRGLQGRGRLR